MSFFFIKYNKYRYIVHFLSISKSITFHKKFYEADETKLSTIIIKYQNYSQNEMENCAYQNSHTPSTWFPSFDSTKLIRMIRFISTDWKIEIQINFGRLVTRS